MKRINCIVLIGLISSCGDFSFDIIHHKTIYDYSNYTQVDYVTNRWVNTNYTSVVVTNEPIEGSDVTLMTSMFGEWLITFESFTDYTNDASGTNFFYFKNSNTFISTTNGGIDGAYTYRFKPNFCVDKAIYNGQGGLMSESYDLYRYSIISNEYGNRIDLEVVESAEEIRYVRPFGETEFLMDPIYEYITKTNFIHQMRITNVTIETNDLMALVVKTNGWLLYIERIKKVKSFIFRISINSNQSNVILDPDTNYYQTISAPTKSVRDIAELINSSVNNIVNYSRSEKFTMETNISLRMRKIR